ncbi:hypothetical protein ACFQBQ_10155 [Granulicella cerasi]|uniref:Uncharacterized protein n=1 Tax=Granulicella cerasi TaxID=741063 RepID=A0ABW1ZA67_9BACT|nr:hypothetical protein [Granulicella cerasi]
MLSSILPTLMFAAPLLAYGSGPDKKNPASYNLPVHVLGSTLVSDHTRIEMRLVVLVGGQCEEWSGYSTGFLLLKPGDYKAFQVERDKREKDYDAADNYVLRLPNGDSPSFSVRSVGNSVQGCPAETR